MDVNMAFLDVFLAIKDFMVCKNDSFGCIYDSTFFWDV